MFNSLVLTWEKIWSDVWYFVSLSILNKCSWMLFKYLSVLKLVMIKNVKIVIIYTFQSKFYQYFVFIKTILHGFVSFCISLIFRYCLLVEKKWWRLNISLALIWSLKNGSFSTSFKIITIFTFLIISNFKTDRYLNNFQEHLFGILRLRKYEMSLQNFFPTWERGY